MLGERAASRLGVTAPGERIWIKDRYFTVLGVLEPMPLVPELDTAVFVSSAAAKRYLGYDGHPTTVYERSADARVESVRRLLPRAANPQDSRYVTVSRPSDALKARQAAEASFTGLLVGLGPVALLVGGIGVANTMVIAVMERRGEIGLRRALGAARGHISRQFLIEVRFPRAGGPAARPAPQVGHAAARAGVGRPAAGPLPPGGLPRTAAPCG
ncbi:FtsX-like permease family protein [Streptomyces sp. NPDC007929]|uniref:ABC transporter permease n=1 Tax=unclassified Streptomyces TaxID=2593676 RepID=UPI0036EEF026